MKKRIPQDREDWGDEETVGLMLKRRDFNWNTSAPNDSFGTYLGKNDNKYVVLQLSLFYQPSGELAYDSVESMKAEWVLD